MGCKTKHKVNSKLDDKWNTKVDARLDAIQIRKVDVMPATKLDEKRDSTLDTNMGAKLIDTILGPKSNATHDATVDVKLVS